MLFFGGSSLGGSSWLLVEMCWTRGSAMHRSAYRQEERQAISWEAASLSCHVWPRVATRNGKAGSTRSGPYVNNNKKDSVMQLNASEWARKARWEVTWVERGRVGVCVKCIRVEDMHQRTRWKVRCFDGSVGASDWACCCCRWSNREQPLR